MNDMTTQPEAGAKPEPRPEESARRAVCTWLAANNTSLTPAQLDQFVSVSALMGLNPLKNEIYATTFKGKMTLITGIGAYTSRAAAHPDYDGMSTEPVGTWFQADQHGNRTLRPLGDAGYRCTVWRKGWSHPVEVTEWLSEHRRNTEPWNAMPNIMLRKCAIAAALRLAFADAFAGMPYVAEEMPPEYSSGFAEAAEYTVVDDPAPAPQPAPEPYRGGQYGGTPRPPQPPQPQSDDPALSSFISTMAGVESRHPAAYASKLSLLGVGDLRGVAPAERRNVYRAVLDHVEAVLASEGRRPAAPPFANEFMPGGAE